MNSRLIIIAAAAALAVAGCSNQSSELDPVKAQAQLKPTLTEKQVSNPKSEANEVQTFCYATDIACYLFKSAYARITDPALKISFSYQISGPSGLGGRVYYVLQSMDKVAADQWLKDLNTQNNGYSWANSMNTVEQWLSSQKIDTKTFNENMVEFEESKKYAALLTTQKQMAVGAWPFFVRGSESKLLSQITRQSLLEESIKRPN